MLYRSSNHFTRDEIMVVAHQLHQMGLRQVDIAEVVSCSQSTASTWIKEIERQTNRQGNVIEIPNRSMSDPLNLTKRFLLEIHNDLYYELFPLNP